MEIETVKLLKIVLKKIDDFFWNLEDQDSLSLCRVSIGVLLLFRLVMVWNHRDVLFTNRGVLSLGSAALVIGPKLNLFDWLPDTSLSFDAVLLVATIAVLFLIFNFFSRWIALVLFIIFVSIDHRNLGVLTGGNHLVRISLLISFLLRQKKTHFFEDG